MSNKIIRSIQERVIEIEEEAKTREMELISKLESYMENVERKFSGIS